jgi:hypothetical protein
MASKRYNGGTTPAPPAKEAEARRRSVARAVLTAAWFTGVVLTVWLGQAAGSLSMGLGAAAVVVLVTAIAAGSRTSDVRAKQASFIEAFGGSLDAVRHVLDLDHLRAVRESQGELHAVREVTKQVPQLTLAQAVDLVRAL